MRGKRKKRKGEISWKRIERETKVVDLLFFFFFFLQHQ